MVQRNIAEAIEGGTVDAVVDELVQTGLLDNQRLIVVKPAACRRRSVSCGLANTHGDQPTSCGLARHASAVAVSSTALRFAQNRAKLRLSSGLRIGWAKRAAPVGWP